MTNDLGKGLGGGSRCGAFPGRTRVRPGSVWNSGTRAARGTVRHQSRKPAAWSIPLIRIVDLNHRTVPVCRQRGRVQRPSSIVPPRADYDHVERRREMRVERKPERRGEKSLLDMPGRGDPKSTLRLLVIPRLTGEDGQTL